MSLKEHQRESPIKKATFPHLKSRLGISETRKSMPAWHCHGARPQTSLTLGFALPANHFSLAFLLFSMSLIFEWYGVQTVYTQKTCKHAFKVTRGSSPTCYSLSVVHSESWASSQKPLAVTLALALTCWVTSSKFLSFSEPQLTHLSY